MDSKKIKDFCDPPADSVQELIDEADVQLEQRKVDWQTDDEDEAYLRSCYLNDAAVLLAMMPKFRFNPVAMPLAGLLCMMLKSPKLTLDYLEQVKKHQTQVMLKHTLDQLGLDDED